MATKAPDAEVNNETEAGISVHYDYVDRWDRLMRDRFGTLMAEHPAWEASRNRVWNAETNGYRHGNLVQDVATHILTRTLQQEPAILVRPHNDQDSESAWGAARVATATMRAADMHQILKEAVPASLWAPFALLWVGHPLDPFTMDPHALLEPQPAQTAADDFEDVDEQELLNQGINPSLVQPLESEMGPRPMRGSLPRYGGVPTLKLWDPRLCCYPVNADSPRQFDYFARLHLLTKQEVGELFDRDYPGAGSNRYNHLYDKVQPGVPSAELELIPIWELWIFRDRMAPRQQPFYMVWAADCPQFVYRAEYAPYNGVFPGVFLKAEPLRRLDTSVTKVSEIAFLADIYHDTIQGLALTAKNFRNHKQLVGPNSLKNDEEKKKLSNPNYAGLVEVNDVSGVKHYDREAQSTDQMQFLMFVKSMAQAKERISDQDRAQMSPNVTATQSRTVLDSSGLQIGLFRFSIHRAIKHVVRLLMHFISWCSAGIVSEDSKFSAADWMLSAGQEESAIKFLIEVYDSESQASVEERIALNQLWGMMTSDPTQQIMARANVDRVVQRLLISYGENPLSAMTPRGAGPVPGLGENAPPTPGMGNLAGPPGQGQGPMLGSPLNEEHPERAAMSRGSTQAVPNLIAGAARSGV